MGKLLIADSNEDFLLALTALLQQHYPLLLCQDGESALTLLRQESCDLLLLDLSLQGLDGLTLLEQARQEGICPPVLALTPLLNNYVIDAVQRLEVRYLIRKPCSLQAVARRVDDLMQAPEQTKPLNKKQYISRQLLALRLAPNLDGYEYLADCILRYAANSDQAFTKELYPAVGKAFHRSGKLVERSIRNALDIAWKDRDDALWQSLFSCGPRRPSCSQVIARLSQELQQWKE